jgi:hypothetical protein
MAGIVPTALRIDSGRHHEDMVVGSANPRFAWAIAGSRTDAQTACRLELWCGGACVWDSGWTASSEPSLAYAGPPLRSGTRYDVFIQLRGAAGHPGRRLGWPFITALFEPWQAPWIAPQDDFGDAPVVFSCDLDLDGHKRPGACCTAAVSETADPDQPGARSRGRLSPLFPPTTSAAITRCMATRTSISQGTQRLEITVAQGWRRNLGPYLHQKSVPFFGLPQLTAILDIGFSDGTSQRIQTGRPGVPPRPGCLEPPL